MPAWKTVEFLCNTLVTPLSPLPIKYLPPVIRVCQRGREHPYQPTLSTPPSNTPLTPPSHPTSPQSVGYACVEDCGVPLQGLPRPRVGVFGRAPAVAHESRGGRQDRGLVRQNRSNSPGSDGGKSR